MKCPKCQFDNRESVKFCEECGIKIELTCPNCGLKVPLDRKFCGECGQKLEEVVEPEKKILETEGERKHVTVLFSDLSGYTAMSEKLDPEEVKEITGQIFSQASQVINKYEGFVEKFVGDAVMALFGVPKAHEDDPVRAIKAAREIHDIVDVISPEVGKRVGQSISMHTGVNTGLVVTGNIDMVKGTHGVAGDTINLASRLSSLAKADEIIVGSDTYRQAEGHFSFETLEPTTVKGKAEPVQVFKVLTPKERPDTIHRLSGLRADLIGRKVEMDRLREAVEELRQGKGMIFSICGDAGTGKSRLVEEFKATIDQKEIQWIEGHAYSYSQNIPYFPLIDLLSHVFQIEEGASSEKVREKIESGIRSLVGEKEDVIPYIGSLYALTYPEIEEISPEFWKSRLQDASLTILSGLTQRAPTIFFLEDLHWADSSFAELLRRALSEVRHPAIVLCVYRPVFSLFNSHQAGAMNKVYQEIQLQDLSASEAQNMVESLLVTKKIPIDLKEFIQEKVEGNPFYLEEVINSLIESKTLLRDNSGWKLTRSIGESDIPSTVQGVISARVDRLAKDTKRVLQEASVIGKAFLYQILKKITELTKYIDTNLAYLEQIDLVRKRSLQPDLEYIFKHALTQEVVYNGLLKKDRQDIHERIGLVMEKLFHDRRSEFYETLAFHFKQGRSHLKAVDYLKKSGEKSLHKFALEESHQNYQEAFDILTDIQGKTPEENALLINLLVEWAMVFYYRGDFKTLEHLLTSHENMAESQKDKALLGMFYCWLGWTLNWRNRHQDGYEILAKAVKLGEETENLKTTGYAYMWYGWTAGELGLFDESIVFLEKALKIFSLIPSDQYLYFKSVIGLGHVYWFKGESNQALEAGRNLLEFGEKHSNVRSIVAGHVVTAFANLTDGNFPDAVDSCRKAIQTTADPLYFEYARVAESLAYLLNGQFADADTSAQKVVEFSRVLGTEWIGQYCAIVLGVTSIVHGRMDKGLKKLQAIKQSFLKGGRRYLYALLEHILGGVYLQIVKGEGDLSISTIINNIGFLLKNVPFAAKTAEQHFCKAIEVAKEIEAKGILAQAYLDLGRLHQAKRRKIKAKKCISKAIEFFKQCGAEAFLKQAKEALDSLG